MICVQMELITTSARQTHTLGEKIGRGLHGQAVISLTGEPGSGKTVFVQGLARGLEVTDKYITSPSYTLINGYSGRLELYHADLYRIENPVDLSEVGIYEILREKAVVAIEWAQRLDESLPAEHLKIHFEIHSKNVRKISLSAYGHLWTDLLQNLTAK